MALSARHQQFINEYVALKFSSATEAYRRVYPNSSYEAAAVSAHELLKNPKVAQEVQRRLDENTMSADEVLVRLADHARGDIDNYLDYDGAFDIKKARKANRTGLIKKLKTRKTIRVIDETEITTSEVEFELYDAQAALVSLGRVHKLFTDRSEVSNEVEFKNVSDTERRILGKLDSLASRAGTPTTPSGDSAD